MNGIIEKDSLNIVLADLFIAFHLLVDLSLLVFCKDRYDGLVFVIFVNGIAWFSAFDEKVFGEFVVFSLFGFIVWS